MVSEKGSPTYKAQIEFDILYEQSQFFATDEEAAAATTFTTLFPTRQRNTYTVSEDQIRISKRESFLSGKWETQKENVPKFACWQTLPQ